MIAQPVISVFMPVFNGEKFLKKSIESVLDQTFRSFELVCVDDSSTDSSYAIMIKYSKIDKRVIVLQKPNGGIVPKSWNFAFPHLRGKFISYMSQDDWMSSDNLELNYKRHLETGASIIVPYLVAYSEHGRNQKIGFDRNLIISGRDAFILSLNWKIHGFCLCDAKLMKSEPFDEGSFNSDEYITRKNFLHSNKVAFSNGIFFYNNDNPNAITKRFKFHTITSLLTDQRLIELMKMSNIDKYIQFKYILKSCARMIYHYFRWKKKNSKNTAQNMIANELFKAHLIFIITELKINIKSI